MVAWWVTAVRDTTVPGGVAGDEAVRGGTEGSGRVRRESAVCEAATAFVSLSGCSAECAAALRMRGMRPARCPDRLHTAVLEANIRVCPSPPFYEFPSECAGSVFVP